MFDPSIRKRCLKALAGRHSEPTYLLTRLTEDDGHDAAIRSRSLSLPASFFPPRPDATSFRLRPRPYLRRPARSPRQFDRQGVCASISPLHVGSASRAAGGASGTDDNDGIGVRWLGWAGTPPWSDSLYVLSWMSMKLQMLVVHISQLETHAHACLTPCELSGPLQHPDHLPGTGTWTLASKATLVQRRPWPSSLH